MKWINVKQIFSKSGAVLFEDVPAKVDIANPVSNLHVYLNGVSSAQTGTPFVVTKYKKITFQVYGSPTSFTVEIKGRVRDIGDYHNVAVVNLDSLDVSSQVSNFGIYTLDVSGFYDITVNSLSVTGGFLNVIGKGAL